MASNNIDWSPDFCLACDRQTEGSAYCSEACRLAEYEVSSTSGSVASSPTCFRNPSWSATTRPANNGFFMEPAYNFSQAKPYGTTPSFRPTFFQPSRPQTSPASFRPALTPSSSQSSLFSMQSTASSTSTAEPAQLSDESRRALREYASSFDQSRYSRRQSQS